MRKEILNENDVLSMLRETSETFSAYNLDITEDADWRSMIGEETSRNRYFNILSEGLSEKDADIFVKLCKNISEYSNLTESANTTAGFIPQAKTVLPLFRFVWPRLVAKEFVNVVPMDAPEIVRYFFRPTATDAAGNKVLLPSYAAVGMGIPVGSVSAPYMVNCGSKTDLFQLAGLTRVQNEKTPATVARGIVFLKWEGKDGSNGDVSGDILNGQVDEEGKFSFSVNVDGTNVDQISGYVDLDEGYLMVSSLNAGSANGKVTKVGFMATVSTAEYNNAAKITFDPKKERFNVEDMQLSAEWSMQWEQDQKARLGLDVQAEFISVFGNQIQLNIDALILNDIIYNVMRYNAGNIEQFNREPQRAGFAHTKKTWAEELLIKIESVSAQIYTDTNLMPASHIVINPKDLVWLKMLSTFDFKGYMDKDGTLGSSPVVGSFQNSYTVLSSPIVPAGTVIIGSKPSQDSFANYMYCPYAPLVLAPYPLGVRPAMTVTSRFARKMLRPEGFGLVQIVG